MRQHLSAIFGHRSVALLLCMACSETQLATLSHTLTDQHKCCLVPHAQSFMQNNQTTAQSSQLNTMI